MHTATPFKVLSLIPPMTQLNTPYPSSAYLTGFLRGRGIDAVQADLSLRVGEQAVTREGLAAALQAATKGDTGQRIHLRADTQVAYGELMATLDALRAAGYLKVALVGLEQGAR